MLIAVVALMGLSAKAQSSNAKILSINDNGGTYENLSTSEVNSFKANGRKLNLEIGAIVPIFEGGFPPTGGNQRPNKCYYWLTTVCTDSNWLGTMDCVSTIHSNCPSAAL